MINYCRFEGQNGYTNLHIPVKAIFQSPLLFSGALGAKFSYGKWEMIQCISMPFSITIYNVFAMYFCLLFIDQMDPCIYMDTEYRSQFEKLLYNVIKVHKMIKGYIHFIVNV